MVTSSRKTTSYAFAWMGIAWVIVVSSLAAMIFTSWEWWHGRRLAKTSAWIEVLGGNRQAVVALWVFEILSFGGWGTGVLTGYLFPKTMDVSIRMLAQLCGLIIGYKATDAVLTITPEWLKYRAQEQKRVEAEQAKAVAIGQSISTPTPTDPFGTLVGLDRAIEALKSALELPILHPDMVARFRLRPPKGILLCGPPGTGKTSLARAAAQHFRCAFGIVTPSNILRPWVGTSEQAVSECFRWAREQAASTGRAAILFFDEIDAIGRKRDSQHLNRPSDLVLNQLLIELDGIQPNSGVFVLAATNRLDVLDEALLRPGRFDQVIEIGLPDQAAREELFRRGLARRPVASDVDVQSLARMTEGLSPAAIVKACDLAATKAAMRAVRDPAAAITMADLEEAIYECSRG